MNKFFEFNENVALGEIFNEFTAYQISIEYLDKAIDISNYLPINKYRLVKAYELRGNSKMRLNNYRESIIDFSKAIEIDPKDSYLYFWRGFAYEFLEEYPNAVKNLKISQQLDPEFPLTKIVLENIKGKGFYC
tara:strand:+ start:214 stop:612 length:399 start_codon:yes stop_codon:yes gene_type:complete